MEFYFVETQNMSMVSFWGFYDSVWNSFCLANVNFVRLCGYFFYLLFYVWLVQNDSRNPSANAFKSNVGRML